MNTPIVKSDFMTPTSFHEAFEIANVLAQSSMIPKAFTGKPGDIVVAMAMGKELGFSSVQSLQNIAVINGRPSVWGDAFRALIIGSPDLYDLKEWYDEKTLTAHCEIQRQLKSGQVATFSGSFSQQDAKTAGLWGKQGPWTQYPKRQQQWRALGFAGRDAYADRLRGIWIDAESQDLPRERDVTPLRSVKTSKLNQVLESVSEEQQAALPNKAEDLQSFIEDAWGLDDLNKAGQEVANAYKSQQITYEDRKVLGAAFIAKQKELSPAKEAIDTETGEVVNQ